MMTDELGNISGIEMEDLEEEENEENETETED